MSPRAAAVLLVLGCVWGASFLFIKVVVDEIPPLELVTGRLFFGTVAVIAVIAYRRAPVRLDPRHAGRVALMALLSNVAPFALIAWAEVHIESGVASVLNSTMPLFTVLFAIVFLTEERVSPARLAGLLAGFVGVVVLTGGDVVRITEHDVLGQLAVVGAAAAYGAGAVYARVLLRSEDPLTLSGLQLVLGTAMALALALAVEGTPAYGELSAKGWLALLTLGVLGSGFAYVAYLWLVDTTGSVRTSLVTYVIPVVGLLLGWAVLDESIGLETVFGAALIILGVAAAMQGPAPASERAAAAEALEA
jgi:drug/metabolite transporter (DMT)-like permease